MDIDSLEDCNWLYDYTIMDDLLVPGGEFPVAATGFIWHPQPLNASPDGSVEIDSSSGDSDNIKEVGSGKRQRSESSRTSCSKAGREKLRRDRLNERFLELVAVMDPGRLPRTDKAAILSDAVRILTQLRADTRQMKEAIDDLQEKIRELKDEKNELRVERQRLREEKERLEQQVRVMAMTSHQTSFLPSHSPAISRATLAPAQGQPGSNNKLMPFISYPSGVTMWEAPNYTA